jgi:hypothetical protein
MIAKVHNAEGKRIVAICDPELLGKRFAEGNKQLDLCSRFYDGKDMESEEILKILPKSYIINAVGKKSVDFLVKNDIAEEKDVFKIKDIPYVQVLFYEENH